MRRSRRKFYRMAWEPAPALATKPRVATDDVLIFSDGEQIGVQLEKDLRARGSSTVLVFANAEKSHANGSGLSLDLRQDDWAVALWKTLAARGPIPTRIVYLWSAANDLPPDDYGCSTLLALMQARLAVAGSDEPARWLIVTHGAQAIRDGERITGLRLYGLRAHSPDEQPHERLTRRRR
jgi:hypothetical protein